MDTLETSERRVRVTPKDFFLWAGAMVALYGGIFAFITLLFSYIDYSFADTLRSFADPYASGMPYQMASLIVLAPLLLVVMRLIRKDMERDPTRAETWVRRWALYLIVFVAGAGMAVDLIVLLTRFLGGQELSTAFLLKVLVVFLVAGALFLHFLSDLRGYWQRNPARARMVQWSVGIAVLAAILSGFFIVGTPQDARQARLDGQKVNDLQSIQWQVVNYWQQKGELPKVLTDLEDPISGFTVPIDRETGEPYGYRAIDTLSFELCADFNTESRGNRGYGDAAPPARILFEKPAGIVGGTWEHGAGETCFERTIDSERYPVR